MWEEFTGSQKSSIINKAFRWSRDYPSLHMFSHFCMITNPRRLLICYRSPYQGRTTSTKQSWQMPTLIDLYSVLWDPNPPFPLPPAASPPAFPCEVWRKDCWWPAALKCEISESPLSFYGHFLPPCSVSGKTHISFLSSPPHASTSIRDVCSSWGL